MESERLVTQQFFNPRQKAAAVAANFILQGIHCPEWASIKVRTEMSPYQIMGLDTLYHHFISMLTTADNEIRHMYEFCNTEFPHVSANMRYCAPSYSTKCRK